MRAVAPGRVNLIGDHTDYTGGLVFPMAIDRWTTIDFEPSDQIHLTSADAAGVVDLDLRGGATTAAVTGWSRYVTAVIAEMESVRGIRGTVSTTLPVGAGLSSSAALEIALALALGCTLPPLDMALLAQRAERRATGVPTGIMDQLCITTAQDGCATMIDCRENVVTHVEIPDSTEIRVMFIAHRTLEGSEYGQRAAECASVESMIGPLRDAHRDSLVGIADNNLRARARHVISENERVTAFARALRAADLETAGALMTESHRSLSSDFAVSTEQMDEAVRSAVGTSGVFGARMTGGGFGGCAVAPDSPLPWWPVRPVGAAHLEP